MKKVFFLTLLFITLSVSAQKKHGPGKRDISDKLANDTVVKRIKEMQDSLKHNLAVLDSLQARNDAERNTQTILNWQKENRQRQKKAAITRIAIGVGFLVILVIGLLRKRKKPSTGLS